MEAKASHSAQAISAGSWGAPYALWCVVNNVRISSIKIESARQEGHSWRQRCQKIFGAAGANHAKGASRASGANSTKGAFCHVPLLFIFGNISTIKTSKMFCALASLGKGQ